MSESDDWSDRLVEKADRYEALLAAALDAVAIANDLDAPRHDAAEECLEMATAYLEDGRHFRETGDLPDALAAFSYGHGWLDAGARTGVLEAPSEGHLFTQ